MLYSIFWYCFRLLFGSMNPPPESAEGVTYRAAFVTDDLREAESWLDQQESGGWKKLALEVFPCHRLQPVTLYVTTATRRVSG